MKQTTTQLFESACGKAQVYVENEMPIGIFHDFLMELKGLMVNRMVVAHQEQLKQAIEAQSFPPLDPPITEDENKFSKTETVPASGTQGA
jgi:hypothetical protein